MLCAASASTDVRKKEQDLELRDRQAVAGTEGL